MSRAFVTARAAVAGHTGGGSRVVRNVASSLVTQLLSWGLSFGVMLFLPAYLQDSGLGALTLAGAFAGVAGVFVALGVNNVLVREIARDHSRLPELVWGALVLRLGSGLAVCGAGWALAALLDYPAQVRALIPIALAGIVVAQLSEVLNAALKGLEEVPRQNVSALTDKFLGGGLTIGLVFLRAPLWCFAAVGLVGTAAAIAVSLAGLAGRVGRPRRVSLATLAFLLAAGAPFLTNAVFTAVYANCSSLLLSSMVSIEAVGWFGVAKRLLGTSMFVPVALTGALLPTLCRLYAHGAPGAFAAAVRRMLQLLLLCAFPVAAVMAFAPTQILRLLHYPPAFDSAVPVLSLAGVGTLLWFLSVGAGTSLVACDRQKVFARVTWVSALVSVPLAVLCIQVTDRLWHNGAIGAMLSEVLLEAGMAVAYVRALPPDSLPLRALAAPARACLAALPLVVLLYRAHDLRDAVVGVAVGLAAYPALCWLLRCLDPEDLSMLRQIVRRKAGIEVSAPAPAPVPPSGQGTHAEDAR